MTPRERVSAVYHGSTPDRVPLLLDLSHWYKKNHGVPFDLAGFSGVDTELVRLHREARAVAYVEMGGFYDIRFADPRVSARQWTEDGVFHTRIESPSGAVEERRVFNETSYSYAIEEFLLQRVEDFPVVIEAMESAYAVPRWERYHAWAEALGRYAYIYAQLPYSGLGYLISRNFGVEQTVYAFYDHPAETKALVDAVNQCNLRILETIIDGPFETLIISDNFDSNVQTRELFNALSRAYYAEVARRLHEAGKFLAVHVDGEMRGALSLMAEVGVDCVDAATPAPMFSLTPAEARAEAGGDLILSGGIPPTVFGAGGSDQAFERAVRSWLETRLESPRLLLAAGDQVPPDAPWSRVMRLAELVDQYGRYD